MTRAHFFQSGPKHRRDPRVVFNQYNSKLTASEIAEVMDPLRAAFTHIREGVATHQEFLVLRSILQISREIEIIGVVRGLNEHITAALDACNAYETRSGTADNWRPSALHFHELDALREMVDLHEFQIKQLTAAEIHEAARRLIARTQSEGGDVYRSNDAMTTLTPHKQQQRKRA